MLAPILKQIVDGTPGARAAILMGFDGISVEQYLGGSGDALDIESLAMEFSFRLAELCKAAESLELGAVSDITIKAERGTFIAHCLSAEYFVAVILESSGQFGKGRWLLRANAPRLIAEL